MAVLMDQRAHSAHVAGNQPGRTSRDQYNLYTADATSSQGLAVTAVLTS